MKKKITQLKEITEKNFPQLLQQHEWVVVEFYTDDCVVCKQIEPMLLQLQKNYQRINKSIVFGKCNGQKEQALARHYMIMSVPTILIFQRNDGLPMHVKPEHLKERLEEIL